ncbi:MAG: hypothetical protein ACYCUI_13965 [Vulcanimicrobiaceae bacterium]
MNKLAEFFQHAMRSKVAKPRSAPLPKVRYTLPETTQKAIREVAAAKRAKRASRNLSARAKLPEKM